MSTPTSRPSLAPPRAVSKLRFPVNWPQAGTCSAAIPPASLTANVNNLFDKKYYDGMGTFNSGSYGYPRNAMVNAKWKF
ncbi:MULTISPECIES: hypothetical protein [unclassified Pseudomonas]|uniref:hypothetical protein n=1 Tax=unclassified Pseudomonas TaxID=196821 RepID=UPI0030DD70E9